MLKLRYALLATFTLAALLPSARASIVYTITADGCGACPPGPYGTITLTQTGTNTVSVVESLSPNVFANTGAGASLGYNLDTTATVSNLLPAGVFATGSGETLSTFGVFTSTIICTGCGSGSSPPQYSTLSFTLTGTGSTLLTTSDFVANLAGYFFVSDIGVKDLSGNVIWTGNLGSKGPGGGGGGGGGAIPEPTTLLLMGGGLVGISLLKRKLS